jgi:hypothetical protein
MHLSFRAATIEGNGESGGQGSIMARAYPLPAPMAQLELVRPKNPSGLSKF